MQYVPGTYIDLSHMNKTVMAAKPAKKKNLERPENLVAVGTSYMFVRLAEGAKMLRINPTLNLVLVT